MKKTTLLLLILLFTFNVYSQDSYKTESGIAYKVGDTIRIGQPISHLGWYSIFKKRSGSYLSNKNLIKKDVIVMSIDTLVKPPTLVFLYKGRNFMINIDEALRNKEVIPPLERELINSGMSNKYELLKQLKELLDMEAITEDEYEIEKKKILESN